jgi:Xaa-Pro dipeptidase
MNLPEGDVVLNERRQQRQNEQQGMAFRQQLDGHDGRHKAAKQEGIRCWTSVKGHLMKRHSVHWGLLVACAWTAACAGSASGGRSQEAGPVFVVRSLEEQARALADFNVARVDRILLPAMRKAGVDCWITMSREHAIDPVFDYIMDEEAEGGHRNAFIFFDDGSDRLTRILIGTHLPRTSRIWDRILQYPQTDSPLGPSLTPALRQAVEELDPKKIAVNESRTIPIADGLTVQMKQFLVEAIGPRYASRLVSAESLIVDFLDTRLPEETAWFQEAAVITEQLAAEVLSNRVIQPGVTKIGDIKWHVRNRLMEIKLQTWFPVGISVYRRGGGPRDDSTVIEPGDIVHTDLGVVYAGLYTDYQRSGYVLRPGEAEPPAGLQAALDNGRRVHEILARVARPGKTGTAVKEETEALAAQAGLTASVGCHSIAGRGHGIGAWFNRYWPDRYSERTRFPVRSGAYYAVEFSTSTEIPEWGGERLRMGFEDDAYATESGLKYFLPFQEKYFIIRTGEGT